MDDSHVDRLIQQCRSNDVDAKVDAMSKLQVAFEAGVEPNDGDSLVNVMKACLRTPNQHLTTATLSALLPLLPLLITHQPESAISNLSEARVDSTALRHALLAFMPPGGVVDRLGDNREKAREKARDCLVLLGGLAFRSGSPPGTTSLKSKDIKVPETPLMIFERYFRENALGSKVWRVREQAILALVHIRRTHHLFPIRPYLTPLVGCLEDTDGTVRECARQSVVELFTGPGVTDAARADLKKEMTKQGVRKTIVDSVLLRLLSGGGGSSGWSNPQSSEGSDNGEAGRTHEYVPPSMVLQNRRPPLTSSALTGISRAASHSSVKELSRPASRAAGELHFSAPPIDGDVQPVYVASSRDLENEFTKVLKAFEGKETEHNWAAREQSIIRIRGMLKGEAHLKYFDTFMAGLKGGIVDGTLKTLASLRTTVAVNTCLLYTDLATILGHALDPFCDPLLTHLLRMAGFTKKITSQQSQACVTTIITHSSAQPRVVLPLLWTTLQEKNIQARLYAVAHVKSYMEVHGSRSKHLIESTGGVDLLDKSVRRGLTDSNIGVRENARLCFWVYEGVWRDKAMAILGTLDATAKKQLEKVCPDPEAAAVVIMSSTPTAKKTSVAAAIAASRAKAKAIATAPPTLRHQATAASHAVRATSPPIRPSVSPASSNRASTSTRPSPTQSPPSSPRHMRTSSIPRPTSAYFPTSDSRSSRSSPSPPPSPSNDVSHRRRMSSSPLTSLALSPGRGSTLHRAMQTALPASPPHSSSALQNSLPRRVPVRATLSTAVPSRPSMFDAPEQEESLLLASVVPIPEDSDSDMDDSANMLSFSAAFEARRPVSNSRSDSRPTPTHSLSTHSPPSGAANLIIEDALRARAEQAESAAERLLELVEPEDDTHVSPIPLSLLLNNGAASKSKIATGFGLRAVAGVPGTPLNRNAALLRQAALFKDSPTLNGSSSLVDVLKEKKHETGWWLKRMSLIDQGTPLKVAESADQVRELRNYTAVLTNGQADLRTLQKLALLCMEYPVIDPTSPLNLDFAVPVSPSPFASDTRSLPSLHVDIWTNDKLFDRLFNALLQFLDPAKDDESLLEYALIVLWEMLENQAPYLEGREADIFTVLLQVRYCNKLHVLEATNTIRDALTVRVEPVYGLTTMHASLRGFRLEPQPAFSNPEVKAGSYAFGLMALGKFILRLPAEILEEELPRMKATLTSALNDASSLVIRESAAACIIAAQLVLRDETHLFTLLDGLADEKKNLLTYLFDKHSARGTPDSNGAPGIEKLEKEMRRLDTRTNTPPRAIPPNGAT